MIPNKQIGWSGRANLLWAISKQLDILNTQMCTGPCPTTTTTTTVALTTTTTTTIPLVNATELFQECNALCGDACPPGFPIYYNVWMTQECIDSWPSIGCEIWYDQDRTVPFPDGLYNIGSFMGCIVVTDGVITDVPS